MLRVLFPRPSSRPHAGVLLLAGYCWRSIATDADPRFHPSAWRRAQRLIHVNHTRCARVGCYPSTGAMAVLYAIDNCRRVTVYGFGSNEAQRMQ